jgi:Na+/H+-dicarboxylate symporter
MQGGLVLLDEEQTRTLFNSSRGEQRRAPPSALPQPFQPRYAPQRISLPKSEGSHARSAYSSSPRTDFRASPRTDFTTKASPRTDFTANRGVPRTDFTTRGSSGKPVSFSNTSPSTGFAAPPIGPAERNDSYPMLRRESSMGSSNGATEADSSDRYAGSSGMKISVRWIFVGVVFGVLLGILLTHLKASSVVAQWVSLPGDLFLRGLKAIVVPYIFSAVAVSIGDIVFVGKVSIVGVQTAKIFAIQWLCSTIMGVAVAVAFRPLFRLDEDRTQARANAIGFTCANNHAVTMLPNASIACVTNATQPATFPLTALFTVQDINHVADNNAKTKTLAALTLSEQLMQTITPYVSPNIFASLANGDTLPVITFAMILGAIAGRNYFTKSRRVNYLYLTLLQSRNALFLILEWLIWLSPGAVLSIIAGSFATNQDSLSQLGNVYGYVLAALVAGLLQTLCVFPAIVFIMARCNPYAHMRQMVRAYIFAFACSSSLATAPVTLACVRKARVCSQSLANFVISIGVTSNLTAVGFYIPIAVIFLAESSGNGDQITLLRIVGIFFLALLSCAGVPPIPSSALVTITTVYSTIFGVTTMPPTFAYVLAMDFLLDRIATVCDVNDDIMALKVIAENTDETVAQDHLGERY